VKNVIMKRQDDTRKLLVIMAVMACLFVAAAVSLSGLGLFLVAQVVAIGLGGFTLVSLFRRYRGLDVISGACMFLLYILMVALFSPGVVQALADYLIR
jgi:ABC-type polysaccharide/polyol phosphate export permease